MTSPWAGGSEWYKQTEQAIMSKPVFNAVSHRSGSKSLASVTHSILGLMGTPPGYPAVMLCYEHPTVLSLQVWPLHVLQQIIDEVDVRMGHLIALVLCLGGSRVGQTASSPPFSPPG